MTIPLPEIIDTTKCRDVVASKCSVSNFLYGVEKAGLSNLVPNCPARLLVLKQRDQLFPLTVNESSSGGSYVVQPHSAYIGYARDQLRHAGFKFSVPLLKAVLTAIGWPLSLAGINQVVTLDNFCVATNLHGSWNGLNLGEIRRSLIERFPQHLIAIRSVDPWTCPKLFSAAIDDDWLMIPARQIWVHDDSMHEWSRKSAVKSDRKILRTSTLTIEDLVAMSERDADRIAELYHALYIVKHSSLSPWFSPSWMRLLHESNLVKFRVARESSGKIVAVAGCFSRGDVMTAPVIGYDMGYPQKSGLYRITSLMVGDYAIKNGLRLNASSGAGEFKRLRGARSQIEYTAYWIGHLSKTRKLTIRGFANAVEKFAIPFLVARSL